MKLEFVCRCPCSFNRRRDSNYAATDRNHVLLKSDRNGILKRAPPTRPAHHHSPHPLRPPHLVKMFAGRLAIRAVRSGASIAPRAAIRSYATPAASQNILPPIALYGIDGTYATALVREIWEEEAAGIRSRAVLMFNGHLARN